MRQLLSLKNLLLAGILLAAAPLCASVTIYEEDFEGGLGGFVIDNAYGSGNGLWHLSTACESALPGHSAVTALAYAQDGTCTFNNGGINQGVATSPGISLPASPLMPIALKAKYFLQTEGWLGVFDVATLEISANGGPFTVIAMNDTGAAPVTLTDGSGLWLEMTADLTAYAGSLIQLRFGFDTVDSIANDYAGFYVDDVTIYTLPVYHEDFENGPGGFVIDNAYGSGNGLWHLSTACESALPGHSAVTTLAYADDGTCTYETGGTNQGVVTSPVIDLSGYPSVTFKLTMNYFLQTEGSPCSWDLASVEVSQNGGPFIAVAHNCSASAPVTLTDGSGLWQEMTADLTAYAGSLIQLRFGFDTVDSMFNDYAGFYVDDITVDVSVSAAVDIKPTSCPNPLNVKSKGVLPVAVLGSDTVDVAMIDPDTITLQGVSPIRWAYEDVAGPVIDPEPCDCTTAGPDGYMDMTLKFDKQEIVSAIGPVDDGDWIELLLEGLTYNTLPVDGSDCVWILKKDKNN